MSFTFDNYILSFLGLGIGIFVLKKWVIGFLHGLISDDDKNSTIHSGINKKYRLISGSIILIVSIVIASFVYFFKYPSKFIVGFLFSWFLVGINLLIGGDLSNLFYRKSLQDWSSRKTKGKQLGN